jgi:hypothetical protein
MGIRKAMRRSMRETAFRLARRDLAMFLKDHEEELLHIFREELQRLDDEIPEESLFIDIKMVPLGEVVLKAALRAMSRFLTEDVDTSAVTRAAASGETSGERAADRVQS